MAKVKVEVLCNNIFLGGELRVKGDSFSVDKEEVDIVKAMDEEAGREFRLKVIKSRIKKLKVENTDGDS